MTTAPAVNATRSSVVDRVPPQDLDAEMALLGSMMMSRDSISDVIPVIGRGDAEWFYLPAHQKLFEVLLDMYDDPSKAVDLIQVSNELRRRELFDFVGGHDYMILLAESFSDISNAEYYAKIVRDKGLLRDLIRCAGQIADEAYTGLDDAREILDVAEQKVFQVTERRVSGRTVVFREAVARLEKQLYDGDSDVCSGVPTGFTQLDEYTGGFQFGDLIIIAGRPSMGKTALGLTMAKFAAVHDQRPVAFFSMEMSVDQLVQRLVCSHGHGVDAQRLRRRTLNEEEKQQVLYTCAELEGAPLFIDDTPGMTVMEVRSKARRLKQREDIQALYVDYLQLMYSPKSESRQVEIAAISRGLKGLARELNIPVVALAQLNRMPEGRADKRPLMSDLRESGAIEQDADVVLLIHRDEYYKPEDESVKNRADLIIAKQRNGPTGGVVLNFNKRFTRFSDHFEGPESYTPAGDNVPF